MDRDLTPRGAFAFKYYTYRPGTPLPNDVETADCCRRGENLHQTAARVEDFFVQADNLAFDQDPRPGYVRLTRVSAPDLLESGTHFVTGFRSALGNLHAEEVNRCLLGASSIDIDRAGQEVTMQRPRLSNGYQEDTYESLLYWPDGRRTCSWDFWRHGL